MLSRICDNQHRWNAHLASKPRASFLQSWEWGEFQEKVGRKAIRIEALEGDNIIGLMQGFERKLALGLIKYIYAPRVYDCNEKLMGEFSKYIMENKYLFLRFEPQYLAYNAQNYDIAPNLQPQHTLILDISKSEDEIMQSFHSKTRYNIHLAERKGVIAREEKNLEVFWKLHKETMERDHFRGHDKEYYKAMIEMPISRQIIAYVGGAPVASHILIVFGKNCAYLHGASGNDARNSMAPYLLQWAGILLGKREQCDSYDFWGVAPPVSSDSPSTCFHNYCWDPRHKWSGITRFKAGFGGVSEAYPDAAYIAYSPVRYKIYSFLKRIA